MYALFLKRIADIFLTLLATVLLSWLLLIIVLIYIVSFQFPILFKQQRIGEGNRTFVVYKFRTLKSGSTDDLDSRRFWWGDVLRFFSLDELPQLWNVLKGEMSMVGPRPLPVEYLPLMNEDQKLRHRVKPGITGWAQVNGRHEIKWEKKFELDEYYVTHLSFGLDLRILFKTIFLLFLFKKDTSLQEKRFEGTKQAR